ncbi:molybdopterin-synthase adenylyltransferase MoeB [Sanguibacter suaedae]|uniref:Molybdopterin-synthase adenylyltransferase MoeB n=1 Tax=Sanguibacter suaedae TaxID=2795737 RepID=A0A934MAD5_9MICO|nr:molybdopterin-synthase adenylyltransferase MoeB [Sanguibacter suaedae]MBI9114116.1 molybdopterin-synthase adenylyltransferase MoeB [Sanguibacter suaedae]
MTPAPAFPPLVAESGPLSPTEAARYARHMTLPQVGAAGQRRLKNARVLVVGAGGLGSPALLYLAAAGIGTLGVVDDDVVDESNLQRQVVHRTRDVGRPKVESARDAVLELNPHVDVRVHPVRLTADNALDVLRGYDLVLDGADNFSTRYLVSDACTILGIPEVWGSIFRFQGQTSVFWSSPPEGFPAVTYRDLFPDPPPPGSVPSCAEGGVLGALCATVGSVMVTEALKIVTGAGTPLLGRLAVYDALDLTWRQLEIEPDPGLERVTTLAAVDASCALPVQESAPASTAPDEITPARLAADLDRGTLLLVDVREDFERDIVSVPGSTHVPLGTLLDGGLADLPRDRPVAFLCKSGARSRTAVDAARAAGLTDAVTVTGGVLAWVRDVDPTQPTY